MVHQFDHVAVGIVNIGVVLIGVLTCPIAWLFPATRTCPAARIGYTKGIQMRQRRLPVVHLHSKVPYDTHGLWHLSKVHFSRADAQLQLTRVARRATVEKFRPEHLLIPLPRALPITSLDVHMMDHSDFGHGLSSFCAPSHMALLRYAPIAFTTTRKMSMPLAFPGLSDARL